MTDFASRIMTNILSKSALGYGIKPADPQWINPDDYASALIQIDQKRNFLNDIAAKFSSDILLQQDEGVACYKNTPCIAALLHKATPDCLIRRWQRLERYVHSEHYTRIISMTHNSLVLEHQSLKNTPPTLAEDMAVMGVLKSLLKQSGADQVHLNRVVPSLISADGSVQNGFWHFEWQRFIPAPPEHPSLSDPIEELLHTGFTGELQAVARAIGFDELFCPRLPQIACKLNLSSRSLQRKLQQHGVTFGKFIQKHRLLKASHYLLQSDLPLSEIGFLSGFSDQPHFCRAFKKNIGMPPLAYRKLIHDR